MAGEEGVENVDNDGVEDVEGSERETADPFGKQPRQGEQALPFRGLVVQNDLFLGALDQPHPFVGHIVATARACKPAWHKVSRDDDVLN